MRTLFLQAPSYDGFDGGAGSRYQARREIKSFWYPTWLAQAAAMVPGSKLIDSIPHGIRMPDVLKQVGDYDLAVLHTSSPSFADDVKVIEALKSANPRLKAGFVGAKVAVQPDESLKYSEAIDFVGRNEFDFTIKELAEGRDWSAIDGLSFRNGQGAVVHNKERAILENMDALPFVTEVYKRDLEIEKYFIGYLKHPYVSFYTGRGCKSRCTFCLWPQTVGGHRYRTRSVGNVIDEIRYAMKAFPQVQEFFFDDDTFTDDLARTEAIAKELGKLGVTWSCNAKANVPRATLKVMRDNGLRLLLVGYEFGQPEDPAQHQEGHAGRRRQALHQGLPRARHRDPRHLHPRPAGRDQGDDRGDHPLRDRDQPAHHPGVAGGALSGHVPLQAGGRERLARCQECRADRRQGRADRAAALSAPQPHRDLPLGRGLLQALLFPRAEDRLDRRRDDPQPADDEAPAARGRRVLRFPARPQGAGALNRLIVTADDFGLADGVNEAVEIAHRTGILSAASLMVASPGAADAVRRARAMPTLAVGLHIVLVEAKPALPPERIPDLVASDGHFRTDMARLGFDIAFKPRVRRQMIAEIAAQFLAFRATGLPLDHVNAHKHFHLHPMIGAAAIVLGKKFGARAIRVPTEPVAVVRAIEPASAPPSASLLAQWTRVLRGQARRAGMAAPDAVFGLAWSGAMTRERIKGLLTRLPPGVVEIYAHPATANAFAGHAPGYRYTDELAALIDPECVTAVREGGYRLGGFADA